MNSVVPNPNTTDINVIAPQAGEAWWILANHQVMKLTSRDTGGALALWFETVPPGGGPPAHVHHAEDEIFIVMEGEITFRSEDRVWAATPGTVVHIPRGLPHTFQNTGATTARFIGIVTPAGFDGYFRENAFRWPDQEKRPPVQPSEVDALLASASRFDLEFKLPSPPAKP